MTAWHVQLRDQVGSGSVPVVTGSNNAGIRATTGADGRFAAAVSFALSGRPASPPCPLALELCDEIDGWVQAWNLLLVVSVCSIALPLAASTS